MRVRTKIAPFDQHHDRYDQWFDTHRAAYVSELLAVRAVLPWQGRGLEIGVGSGRFAAPLGVAVGLDPSHAMLARAAARGITTVAGVAEALPFPDAAFDYALAVTTLCFVDSPAAMFAEARRVLRPEGTFVVGFIDRQSALGQSYDANRAASVFYRDVQLYSAAEVDQLVRAAGLVPHEWVQTLFRPPAEITEIEPVRAGTGSGAFVVVAAAAPSAA